MLLRALRALRALPAGYGPVSLRVDSGFYTVELLEACRGQRVEFCVSVARTKAMWARLYAKLNVKSWRPALDMEGAEVAEFAYKPDGWKHEPLRVNRPPGPRGGRGGQWRRAQPAAADHPQGPEGAAPPGPGGLRLQLQLPAH